MNWKLTALAMALVLAGCGGEGGDSRPAPESAQSKAEVTDSIPTVTQLTANKDQTDVNPQNSIKTAIQPSHTASVPNPEQNPLIEPQVPQQRLASTGSAPVQPANNNPEVASNPRVPQETPTLTINIPDKRAIQAPAPRVQATPRVVEQTTDVVDLHPPVTNQKPVQPHLVQASNTGLTDNGPHTPQGYQFISDVEDWTDLDWQVSAQFQGWDGFGRAVKEPVAYYGKLYRNFAQFDADLAGFDPSQYESLVLGASIAQLQELMDDGRLTSVELTKFYLFRIGKYDIDKLNSVLELNPDALVIAAEADQQRGQGGMHSDMLGIPVLIKDNIATNDRMHTTGGMVALLDWDPDHDAYLVKRLRDAGAVILGKANLSENANFFTQHDPNGFSNLGGQTRNPYGFYSVRGSSSGSAVATAAEFAAVTVGTETQGSINAPAEMSSVVGFKPSMGLVSRDNVIPLASSQDSPGPIAKSVEDAARLLNVLGDLDANDPLYAELNPLSVPDYSLFLGASRYQSLKVAVLDSQDGQWKRDISQALTAAGVQFEFVDSAPQAHAPNLDLNCEFKYEFAEMAEKQDMPQFSVRELVEYNSDFAKRRAAWGQEQLTASAQSRVSKDRCLELASAKYHSWKQAVASYFDSKGFDALVSKGSLSAVYAPAGAPSASVPFGYQDSIHSITSARMPAPKGTPISVHIMGKAFDDGKVLGVARAIEVGRDSVQGRGHKWPDLDRTVQINRNAGAFDVHNHQRQEAASISN